MLKRPTAALLVTGAALAAGGVAHADTQTHGSYSQDGAVWLYKASGGICKIHRSRDLTRAKCLNANIVRVENHGFTSGVHGLVNARLYYNKSTENGGRSAYACISPQDTWTRGAGGVKVHFNQLDPAGANVAGTGLNKAIWHDVARVQWTSAPCI